VKCLDYAGKVTEPLCVEEICNFFAVSVSLAYVTPKEGLRDDHSFICPSLRP
jgi:hypothetical protein